MKSRIMYIEQKTGDSQAFIGRVTFSKSGRTLYYRDMAFMPVSYGIGGNYHGYNKEEYLTNLHADVWKPIKRETYWISGPKKNGQDRLFGRVPLIQIDADVREEYWKDIRGLPELVEKSSF